MQGYEKREIEHGQFKALNVSSSFCPESEASGMDLKGGEKGQWLGYGYNSVMGALDLVRVGR